jgi:predicted enzyme related to lactoylglutathione lyase
VDKVKPNGGKLIEHTQKIGQHGFRFIILDII